MFSCDIKQGVRA